MTDSTAKDGAPTPKVLLVGPVSAEDEGSTTGGVAVHVSELARALAADGLEVAVYADNLAPGLPAATAWGMLFPPPSRDALPLVAMRTPGGAKALSRALLARSEIANAGWNPAKMASHAVGLRRALADFQPNVVHYHHIDIRPFIGRLAGVACATVVTAHSLSAFRDDDARPRQEIAARNLRDANLILAVSPDTAEAISELVEGVQPRYVPNGIDVAAFAHPHEAPDDAPPTRPLVLYLGWLAEHKGVLDLVAAVSSIAETRAVSLAVVGPEIDLTDHVLRTAWRGPDEAFAVSAAIGRDAVVAWLHAADVFVLPSRVREGQSRVVIEAFAAGTPVVACDVGAVGDLLEQGALGLLVSPGDPGALADAIESVLDRSAEARVRASAAKRAVATFDMSRVIKLVEDAYGDALGLSEAGRP